MNGRQIVTYLSSIPFFAEVSRESLDHLCEGLEAENYDSLDTIFNKGDEGDAMFVILEGRVKVHDNGHVYDFLEKGECFGEYSLIDNQSRSASITAADDTSVLRIKRNHFLDLMAKDSGFAQGILSVMIKRHRDLDVIQERLAASNREIELANSKMSGLINGAMDAIIMFDDRFRITLANPSAMKRLQNEDVLQRNLLFFMDEDSSRHIEDMVESRTELGRQPENQFLSQPLKLIGSNGLETINEATLSQYGIGQNQFYTLILRNLADRLEAEHTIEVLSSQTAYLEEEIESLTQHYGILGEDPSMVTVLNHIQQVAPTDATVLIRGETGTGKELVARAIHQESAREEHPMIRINCGAIPANLIESELFGHEKGAFTGATTSRKGRFELAHQGSLFLDEIGELPLDLQPKLLRVLQEGEFDPLGSSNTIKVDVRIIAATHRDLLDLVKQGKFREDLYYRLNVYPIEVPPLRERGSDIGLIAQEMLRKLSAELNKKTYTLTEEDKEILMEYKWPGNVRELENLIERALIISRSGKIDFKSIIPDPQGSVSKDAIKTVTKIHTNAEWLEMERANILRALKKTSWKISGKNGAAQLLKIPPTTLASRIKALDIKRPV